MSKYNENEIRDEIISFWKKNNYFKDHFKGSKKGTFTILMPPPNVTGNLHLGHAWDLYYPDALIRYKQLQGYEAIWYPGMDHAGIATQAKVEKRIFEEEGKTRWDLGRDKFLKRVWSWKDEYANNIKKQWDQLGIAINEDKLKFTLDKDVEKIVLETFVKQHDKKLIYRDKKMINWDPKLKTSISNIEIETKEVEKNLYNIKYQIKNSKDKLTISTSRPETIFGDEAIAINPKDDRYSFLKKEKLNIVINPLTSKEIPIIYDEYVKLDFGSGVMKITPAHDFNDYELGKKHKLSFTNIFNDDATLNEKGLEFQNLDRYKVRKLVIEKLQKEKKIDSIKKYQGTKNISERSGVEVEPKISTQWFLKASKLSKLAKKNQSNKETEIDFHPKRFEKEFLNWIDKMEDWNISRQLWWGHRIPAWYKNEEIKVQINSPGKDWKQDEDVLDTWFSSALWPEACMDKEIMKRSENKKYLTDTLFTGYDIIFFWVSRMIFQSLNLKKNPPFKNVIIHGLIRDSQNRKMSKSLNNGVNPIEVIKDSRYGSDVLRWFLLSNSTPGEDIKFNVNKLDRTWKLCNKIINSFEKIKKLNKYMDDNLKIDSIDHWFLEKINNLKNDFSNNIEKYNLSFLSKKVEKLFIDDFANTYLELKTRTSTVNKKIFNKFYKFILILLHPFLPILTEKIYKELSINIKDKNIDLNFKNSILEESYNFIYDFSLNKNLIFEADTFIKMWFMYETLTWNYKFTNLSNEFIYIFDNNYFSKIPKDNLHKLISKYFKKRNFEFTLTNFNNYIKINPNPLNTRIYVEPKGFIFIEIKNWKNNIPLSETLIIQKEYFQLEKRKAKNNLDNKYKLAKEGINYKKEEETKLLNAEYFFNLIEKIEKKIQNENN